MTLESLIAEAHELGWYVYQTFESPDHRWLVYLRHPDCLIAYGQGLSFADAFESALAAIPNAVSHNLPHIPSSLAKPADLASVLAKLTKQEPIKRRI